LTMPMYLHTLGGLRLEGSAFSRPKPLLLLAYLALEGSQPRSRLAELFFMETSDGKNSLSRALTYLRKEVPGVIEADNKKVWTTVSCDAAELLNLTDSKQFEKCLKLYQGAFAVAVDYDLELSGELEEWFYATREILAAKARNAFLALGEQEASKGNFSQAAHLAEKAYRLKEAAELEPDDFGRLYNLLYAGNSPLATEVKKEAEGFEIPLELSREEAKAHLSETSETKLETANNLPLPKSSFVGRDQELVAVATQLAKVDCRLLTLHGTGGVGKSRLALQAAYDQLKGGSWEGVYFVALDALNSHELIGSSIAEALGLELQGQDDTLSQVQRFIGKKHLLFVLDNYEHLIAGATLTSKLLASCPHLKILVTSRERLNVEEEWVLTLEGLTVPAAMPDTLNEAQHFEAVDMFLQRAKRARLDFAISEGDLPHVLKICRLVDGLPLGIELAAVWVKTLPVSEIAKEIESNLNILETPSKNVAERHQSIRAAFEHSWKLLTEKEQEVLRKLSVFVGGFRREAAAEVVGATLPILASLVDGSLVRVDSRGRYNNHVLVRDYIYEKLLEKSIEKLEIQDKYEKYFFGLISKLGTVRNNDIFKLVDEELQNIRSATQTALRGSKTELFEQVSELVVYFEGRGRLHEGRLFFSEIAQHLITNASHLPNLLGSILIDQAWFEFRLGEFSNALHLTKKGLELSNSLSQKVNYRISMKGLNNLAAVEADLGNYSMSKKYAREALKLAHDNQDTPKEATYLENLALAEEALGNYQRAEKYRQRVLEIDQGTQNYYGMVITLSNLGKQKIKTGDFREAQEYIDKGLELAQNEGILAEIPVFLHQSAIIQCQLSCYARAITLCEEALAKVDEIGNPSIKSSVLTLLGKVATIQMDYTKAFTYLTKGLHLAWSIRGIPAVLENLTTFAELLQRSGKSDLAYRLWSLVVDHPNADAWVHHQAQHLLEQANISKLSQRKNATSSEISLLTLESSIEKVLSLQAL
jgi:predicted ATPase